MRLQDHALHYSASRGKKRQAMSSLLKHCYLLDMLEFVRRYEDALFETKRLLFIPYLDEPVKLVSFQTSL